MPIEPGRDHSPRLLFQSFLSKSEEWDGICTFVNITYTCAGAGFVLKIQFVYPFVADIRGLKGPCDKVKELIVVVLHQCNLFCFSIGHGV